MDLHLHMRAELTSLCRDAVPAQQLDKSIHERFRYIGQGRICERGPASFAGIRVERELGDDDRFPFDIQHGKIGLALFIFEDAQVGNLLREKCDLFLPIAVTNAQ